MNISIINRFSATEKMKRFSNGSHSLFTFTKHPGRFFVTSLILTMACGFRGASCGVTNVDVPEMVEHGKCSITPNMEEIDMEKFSGIWYQVQEVPNQYVIVKQCIRTKYIYNGTSLLVTTEGLDRDGDLTDQLAVISKVVPKTSPVATPYLELRARNVPPVPYHILTTDYNRVACHYSCFELLDLKVEVFSILTRTPYPTEDSLAMCKRLFQAEGLNLRKLRPVKQGEGCWYNTERSLNNSNAATESFQTLPNPSGDNKKEDSGRIAGATTSTAGGGDENPSLGESEENILISIIEEVEADDKEASRLSPSKGNFRIRVGDRKVVNLNITKISVASMSVEDRRKKNEEKTAKEDQNIDETLLNNETVNTKGESADDSSIGSPNATVTKKIVTASCKGDKDGECQHECVGMPSSAASASDFVGPMMTLILFTFYSSSVPR